jgi:transcriptional regulator with XRE-family HTH domain
MSLNYQAIGHRIMVIRKRNRISQLDFSELIDKSPTYVSYIENGKKRMSLETFVQIANALDIPADILLAEQLTGSAMAASQEVTMLLEDCSGYERMVITDTVKAIKASLRDRKSALSHTNR